MPCADTTRTVRLTLSSVELHCLTLFVCAAMAVDAFLVQGALANLAFGGLACGIWGIFFALAQ